MDQVLDVRGSCFWLITIPGDGDCLFGAIANQIYGITPKHSLFKLYIQLVRDAAVSEIRMNLPYYYDHVASYAEELVFSGNSTAEKVEQYLNKLQTTGFWGGAESIIALANYFKVVFVVHQDHSKIEFAPASFENGSFPRHNLFYRGHGSVKSHYDSVLCIRLAGSTAEDHDLQTFQLPNLSSEIQVKVFGNGHTALLHSIAHQLTHTVPSDHTIHLLRCLVDDEVGNQPPFHSAYDVTGSLPWDVPCPTSHQIRSHEESGVVTLVVLSAALNITIFQHSLRHGSLRYDPSSAASRLTIHIFEDSHSSGFVYGSILSMSCTPSRSIVSRRYQPDPMMIASKIARKEHTDSQLTEYPMVSIDPQQGLRFASLNVRGCRTLDKREAIDSLLISHRAHVAALQEVNLECQFVSTANFLWHMGGPTNNKKRGLAILIRHGLNATLQKSTFSGTNIQHAEILYQVIVHLYYYFFLVFNLFFFFTVGYSFPKIGYNKRTWTQSRC